MLRGPQTVSICSLHHLVRGDMRINPHLLVFLLFPDRISSTISSTPNDSKTDFPEMESSHSQRSLCRSDEQLPPPPVSHTQTCFGAPSDLSLPFSNNLTAIPLHNNNSKNSRAPHGLQRRVHYKVKGKKSAKRT